MKQSPCNTCQNEKCKSDDSDNLKKCAKWGKWFKWSWREIRVVAKEKGLVN